MFVVDVWGDTGSAEAGGQAVAYLQRLLFGAGITKGISVVAELGIPDLLADGPVSCAELAAATGTNRSALYRVMRVLAGEGVFTWDERDRFGLTAVGALLRSGCAGSQRSSAIMKGSPWEWAAWGALGRSVEDEGSAFSHAHGVGLFGFLDGEPAAAAIFHDMMTGLTSAKCEAILAAYDFSGAGVFADVGGGHGVLMAAALAAYPKMRGILFDQPPVAEGARPQLEAAGVADRCRIVGGDFFEAVPGGADVYALVSVLLNWDDQQAEAILGACHAAMSGRGRLIVVDWVVPAGSEPHTSKYLDLQMLVLFGSRSRTEAEFTALLARSGFAVLRVIETPAGFGLIEAEPIAPAGERRADAARASRGAIRSEPGCPALPRLA